RHFICGVHPAVLDDRGLDAALSGIATRSPIPVRLHVELDVRPSRGIEAAADFLVSEPLTTPLNHSGATLASLEVPTDEDRIRIRVEGDRRGGADPARGSGLSGLQQRIDAVDGTLRIDSPAGGPTSVTGELPCAS